MNTMVGIRKENIDLSEKRAPLTPEHVASLTRQNIPVIIEPGDNRIFKPEEYLRADAEISDDLSGCNIIFGVKEIPIEDIHPGKNYCFFSHTIKGQDYNMPLLKHILNMRATLIDYEKITDENGRRLIFFGRYAGYAGMINSLWSLGQRLKYENIESPFSNILQAMNYSDFSTAKEAIAAVGNQIRNNGIGAEILPLVTGFTGYGQVSQGAQEVYDLLPVIEISPQELLDLQKNGDYSKHHVYKVVFKEADMFEPKEAATEFDLSDYFSSPEKYKSKFDPYIPLLTIMINGIYWETKYPKLVTKKYLKELFAKHDAVKLKVIGDITCDVEGSVECNLKGTNSFNPVYVYHPDNAQITDGFEGHGLVVLAVDKLPSELPRDASQTFGSFLLPFVKEMAEADYSVPFEELNLPAEIKRAVITYKGKLTPDFQYLQTFLK